MDINEYVLEILVRDRLAEMRAEGERSNLVRAVRPAARPLRVALGHALIRMGDRLQGAGEHSFVTIEATGAIETRRTTIHGGRA